MSDIEEIKNRINVVDFVGQYVRLDKAGLNWKARCPFHSEKSPSFMVSEERQTWHCFGCGKGGDIFTFLMEMESLDFKEALKILAEKAGVELNFNKSESGSSGEKSKVLEILEFSTKFYEKQLWDGAGKSVALEYLRKRGLKDEAIKNFRLGFAPAGWNNIQEFLIQKGYLLDDVLKTGLLVDKSQNSQISNLKSNSYDRFRSRIMFPICDVMENVIGFTSRALPGEDEQAKYVNTPETLVYHKSKALYGIEKAKQSMKGNDFVLLVEGNMDVIASSQAGVSNVVAVSGTALTQEQLEIIGRYTRNIKMFFDMDEAGQKAALRSFEIASGMDMNVSIVSSKEGKDAADLALGGDDRLLETVGNSMGAMEYFFSKILEKYNKDDVVGKKKIAEEALKLVGNFSNDIERQYWIGVISREIGVSEDAIRSFFSKKDFEREVPERKTVTSKEAVAPKGKTDIIKQKMIELIIANSSVWRKAVENHRGDLEKYFKNGKIMDFILNKGAEIEFCFEKSGAEFQGDDVLRRIYFSDDGHINEDPGEDKWSMFEEYLRELKRNVAEEEISVIVESIKEAEARGDREAVSGLVQSLQEAAKNKR